MEASREEKLAKVRDPEEREKLEEVRVCDSRSHELRRSILDTTKRRTALTIS